MTKAAAFLPAILAVCLWTPLPAQDDMPEAPGKAMTVHYCTGCHGAEMFAGSHKSSNDWDQIIATMTDKGLSFASDADYATVLDYFSTCLGPQLKKVNINKAAACELARMLSISTPQAESIVAWREKNGSFKDLNGLKKMEGLDAAVIDANKDAITF